MTPKQAKFVEDEGALIVDKLAALAVLARHVGLIAPCMALSASEDELARRLSAYGSETLDACLSVITDPEADPIRRAACGLMLECFLPNWRQYAPAALVGMVVEREDAEVRRWRRDVLQRDRYQCVECGSDSDLEAHHIVKWADAPAMRIVLQNGRTLCRQCHRAEHARA